MPYNALGKVTKSNLRRWTQSAIDCYERGCNCNGCILQSVFVDYKCQMKVTVLELVKVLGRPEKG